MKKLISSVPLGRFRKSVWIVDTDLMMIYEIQESNEVSDEYILTNFSSYIPVYSREITQDELDEMLGTTIDVNTFGLIIALGG